MNFNNSFKDSYQQTIHLQIIYNQDLALNNPKEFICYETPTNHYTIQGSCFTWFGKKASGCLHYLLFLSGNPFECDQDYCCLTWSDKKNHYIQSNCLVSHLLRLLFGRKYTKNLSIQWIYFPNLLA